MIPYLLTAALFLALAALASLASSLSGFDAFEWFNGLRWVRIHLVTLGAMTEAIFGFVPMIAGRERKTRWSEWFLLTGGIVVLLVGIPLLNEWLIYAGGTLVFAAVTSLTARMRGDASGSSARFYMAGLGFLLLGVYLGTGLWFGWGEALSVKVPLEVHIHANNWGFLSLVFAGLVFDRFEAWTGRPLLIAAFKNRLFWMMSLGALGLVVGPWTGSLYATVPGLVLHIAATVWLLVGMVRSLSGAWGHPGPWHLVTSYLWLLAPVMMAPLVILEVGGFDGGIVEANAPTALIYGWVLQFGIAVFPAMFARPNGTMRLGGSWWSLAAGHLGAVFLWVGIFAGDALSTLHGVAFALWVIAIVPAAMQLGGVAKERLEAADTAYSSSERMSSP